MKRRLFPLLAGLLAVSACYMPPFDEALLAAYSSAKKMRHDATIGPYHMWEGDFSRYNEVRFLPKKTPNPDGGFLLRHRNGELRISWITRSFSGVSQYELNAPSIPYNQNMFNYAAGIVPHSVAGTGSISLYSNNFPPAAELRAWLGNFVNLSEINLPPTIPTDIGGEIGGNTGGSVPPWTLISGQYGATQVADSEYFLVLARDSTGLYYECRWMVSTNPAAFSFDRSIEWDRFLVDQIAIPFPVQPANGHYFYSPTTGRSYLSTYANNRWVTYCWYNDGGLQFRLLSKVSKLVSVLSTGELYAESSTSGEVYDPAGNLKYSISLGGMRLAHEMYENGAYRLVFVQRLMFNDNDGGEQGQWEVYSIPTVDLKNLD